jgi:myo-inositol catabolism protein IolS
MNYRRLGQTGLTVSAIGVGTFQYGGEWGKQFTPRDVGAILGRARDLGINLLDTAECYGDHLAEALIGGALQGRRHEWVVATKFGHLLAGFLRREDRWAPADVARQLDDSLRALRTDYVDLYQFHSGSDATFRQDELWALLERQVRAGKVRHLGVSLGFPYSPVQMRGAAAVGVGAIQVRYNRLERVAEEEVLPYCQAHDLGVLARVPLASGFLTGAHRPGAAFRPDDLRSTFPPDDVRAKLAQVEELRRTEVPADTPLAAWALAWCLRHPAVTCVIPGCKSVAQVEENARAAELIG